MNPEIIAAWTGAVGVVGAAGKIAWQVVQWTRHWESRWEERGETLSALVRDVVKIRNEVTPNGGGSIKDAVSRLEADLAMERGARRFTISHAATYDVRIVDSTVVDPHVSADFITLTGLTPGEVSDNGWLRWVHPSDRERLRALTLSALETQDAFVAGYTGRNVVNGKEYTVEHVGRPVRTRPGGPVIGWVGAIIPMGAS